ncbi:hypothetical protein [Parasitella parasitica]|uniref:RING-type domain-containing protein n=1 Tax=Parasitella parasitica TaxID=35722 RepID=A0A0B7MVU4_9FUNG|nr:hypothetical protein [Parasitella parasitica]
MGQRQSSTRQGNSGNNSSSDNSNDNSENTTRRGRIFRPSARLNVERSNPISRTSNENQRRNERRTRRARIREEQLNGIQSQQQTQEHHHRHHHHHFEEDSIATLMTTVTEAIEAATAIATSARNRQTTASANTPDTIINTAASDGSTAESTASPFSRMIAQVISEAVVASFRNGQIPSAVPNSPHNVRQQLTMHLSPELFRQLEPESTEDTFMRFMRLPVIVTSVSTGGNDGNNTTTGGNMPSNTTGNTSASSSSPSAATSTAVNADGETPTLAEGESEITRLMMLPVFLYGLRSVTQQASTDHNQSPLDAFNINEPPPRQGTRSSSRIRERRQRQQAEQQESSTRTTPSSPSAAAAAAAAGGQWTVYIISGNSVENIMNDSPSYEELLDLAALIGPARRPTVSQEAIDNYVPIVKYTQQVKQTIVGNSEGCQVCLNSYQSEDDVRVLACHHGFHKDCIDKWLTEGQNQCPLCRGVPIPIDTTSPTTND